MRHIFHRYVLLKSLPKLATDLRKDGIVSKRWQSRNGKAHGGLPFTCGALSHILNNRVYRGYAVHKGKAHPGEHEAIIDEALFNAAQDTLEQNRIKFRNRKTRAASSPLSGKIHDHDGQPMRTTFSYGRGKVMYRYYVSDNLLFAGRVKTPNDNRKAMRLAATRLEAQIAAMLAPLCQPPLAPDEIFSAVTKLTILESRFLIEINSSQLYPKDASCDFILAKAQGLDPTARLHDGCIYLSIPTTLNRRGKMICSPDKAMIDSASKQELANFVKYAHNRLHEANAAPHQIANHADMKGPKTAWIAKRMVIGLLAPDIQKAMLAGTLPLAPNLHRLLDQKWPLDWAEQRQIVGMTG